MRIAIVDNDAEFAQEAESIVRAFCGGAGEEAAVSCFTEGYALLDQVEAEGNYDIYILDVEMPDLDGLELAKRIREREEEARIVILSAYEKYALPGYKVRPYDYIVKQKYREELPDTLDRIWRDWQKDVGNDIYIIQDDRGMRILRMDEILYLEKKKKKKYTAIYCSDGQEYCEKLTLEKLYEKFPKENFLYINRSIIINMKHVTCLETGMITLANRIRLPVSRYRILEVKDGLAGYWGKKW